jgi:hypothetical protein
MKMVKKSRIFGRIPLSIIICIIALPAYAKYSGGAGTPNDPYKIAAVSDLISLGENQGDYDKCFILTNNIDMNPAKPGGRIFNKAVIAFDADPGDNWSYFRGLSFTGIFDGNGHTISNLTITGENYIGLFGQIESVAIIKNLGLVNVNITSTGSYVGGMVGYNYGNISNCYIAGSVSATGTCVGGLTGQNTGAIINSYTMGIVEGNSYVGGLAGVNGEYFDLGAGVLEPGLISNCYSASTVRGSTGAGNSSVGGLVGRNWEGTVSDCFWDIQTSGQTISDGGKGLTTIQMQEILNYLKAGWDWIDEISNGTHEIWQMSEQDNYPVLTIFNGYTPLKLQGKGTAQEPYLISNAKELGAIYYGNTSSYYRLAALIDLSEIHWSVSVIPWFSGKFDGNNLTISNLTIADAGSDCVGLFGQLVSGAEVKNLGIADVNIVALGSCVSALVGKNSGSLTNCYCIGSVTGTGDYVGGLAGVNGGTMLSCYSISSVNGNDLVGGLVGYNDGVMTKCYNKGEVTGNEHVGGLAGGNGGSLSQCYNMGNVTGIGWNWNGYAGGLMGKNDGDVSQCYNAGAVAGNEHVGGLAGINGGSFVQCYSKGKITGSVLNGNGYIGGLTGRNDSVVSGCFWDTQTSGQTISDSGTGKTTIEMQKKNTFAAAHWDFVGETANGSQDIWSICEGTNYPRLVWQIPVGDYVCPDGIAMEDFAFFMDHWGDINCNNSNGYCQGTDLDFSGAVNINDYQILINYWLNENQ